MFQDGGEGPPEVSAAFGTAQLTITSAVANPTIRFADSSLEVSVSNDGMWTCYCVTKCFYVSFLSASCVHEQCCTNSDQTRFNGQYDGTMVHWSSASRSSKWFNHSRQWVSNIISGADYLNTDFYSKEPIV